MRTLQKTLQGNPVRRQTWRRLAGVQEAVDERSALFDDVRAAEAELDSGLGIPHPVLKRQVAAEVETLFAELGL